MSILRKKEGKLTNIVIGQITEEEQKMKMQLVKEIGQKEYEGKGIVALDFVMDVFLQQTKETLLEGTFTER